MLANFRNQVVLHKQTHQLRSAGSSAPATMPEAKEKKTRAVPLCKTCHKPMKGHPKVCPQLQDATAPSTPNMPSQSQPSAQSSQFPQFSLPATQHLLSLPASSSSSSSRLSLHSPPLSAAQPSLSSLQPLLPAVHSSFSSSSSSSSSSHLRLPSPAFQPSFSSSSSSSSSSHLRLPSPAFQPSFSSSSSSSSSSQFPSPSPAVRPSPSVRPRRPSTSRSSESRLLSAMERPFSPGLLSATFQPSLPTHSASPTLADDNLFSGQPPLQLPDAIPEFASTSPLSSLLAPADADGSAQEQQGVYFNFILPLHWAIWFLGCCGNCCSVVSEFVAAFLVCSLSHRIAFDFLLPVPIDVARIWCIFSECACNF